MLPLRILATVLAFLGLAEPVRPEDRPGFAEQTETLVSAYARNGIFSGAVIVARDGQPLFRRAYGLANREWAVPNTPATRFRIASLTKQFTAAAILRLAESGALRLDDPAARYVPGLPPSWGAISVRMLLNHSSGLPNFTALPAYASTLSRIEQTPMEIVALLYPEDLLFPPGTGHEYGNTGYVLLAAVIERITGRSFEDHLRDTILAPLGLVGTGDADPDAVLPGRAAGYTRRAGTWRNAPPLAARGPSGAGGLISTLDDLVAWDRALLTGRVLSHESFEAMFANGGHDYGLGWYLGTAYGERLWSHGGFLNGFAAIKDTYPDLGLTIVVLGNTETTPAQALSRRLAGLYLGRPAQTDIAVPDTVLDRYVGFYRIGPRSTLTLARGGGRIVAQATGGPRRRLAPESDRIFVAEDGSRLCMDIDPDGRATGVLFEADGLARAGARIDAAAARRITARRVARLTAH